ncbi:MAG: GIY-YIG nuclease family protein [Saprospiraceae bacterium]|jgi:putative endonuclease|nr:GIY-YIG nuclease family protein [Saprospiraceae bacterium]MBK7370663.1 GIY-YIG nuclease family protein [Saprospiraceae bacterium]MBK7438822.1 GIY-YIG nuclease family protein [Saprospiraceae bacterium]MBK8279237.1 GIY-YIG nuclease family protein [Saprospiraceae bacterium]MBK8511559.1 GIY-YIG nuclease family protein [Saprospiraceae bacterium]
MQTFVYVIQSSKDFRLYVGMTGNVEKRIEEHNKGLTPSTQFYRPWKLVYLEEYPDRISARNREKYLKSGSGKEFLKRVINLDSNAGISD